MIDPQRYPRLSRIALPADLRQFPESELPAIADELRAYLIEQVAKVGGHFGAGLGVIELTVALHWLYETPVDRLVWDVGHQCYPHKILTGRRDTIHTVKQKDGVAPFPKREESEYDTFGVGHSSTSISAALGMALAAKMKGESRHAVAIIGDGAMTAGMAFEALNNAGVAEGRLLVVLNDNDMSISPPVGALNKYLARLMSGKFYTAAREGANIELQTADGVIVKEDGPYTDAPFILQEFAPLPKFGDSYTLIGSWVIGDQAAGIGVREDNSLITKDSSRFLPHLILD